MNSIWKFIRSLNGITVAANVELSIATSNSTNINIACVDSEPNFTQGNIIEVSKKGFDSWKQAAIAGIKYALNKLPQKTNYDITVTKILGSLVDSNPTVIALAAVKAIWNAFHYIPNEQEVNMFDSIIIESLNKSNDFLHPKLTEKL